MDFNEGVCPLCSSKLKNPLPEIEMIKASIRNLDKAIANVTRSRPKLRAFIDGLEKECEQIRECIRRTEYEIDGIYYQEQEAQKIKDLNARRAKVIGRISLWVESVENDTQSEGQDQRIQEHEARIKEINNLLDEDSIEERKKSVLSRIQVDMTEWANSLQLEHRKNPYRLDLSKVTVIVDKPERPVPLKQLGSGSNWVGVHLITYFALHKFFINNNRPVPRFLFLDQPSQVYFPSEIDEKETDWEKVNEIYSFIIERVQEASGKLQAIIVDHANLKSNNFRELVIENWWSDANNLIPKDWYEA